MRKILLCLFILLIAHHMQADMLRITGKVVFQEDNTPIFGVVVTEKNNNHNQTYSDYDGTFSINVEKGAILEFTYALCLTREVEVVNDSSLIIAMEPDKNLENALISCPQPIAVIWPDSLDFILPKSELHKLQRYDKSLSGSFVELSNTQIGRAKCLLSEEISTAKNLYHPFGREPMPFDRYAKQYLGVKHNGHVIVLINLVSTSLLPHFRERISENLISVDDGGNSFGRAKIDLTSDVLITLRMNGN